MVMMEMVVMDGGDGVGTQYDEEPDGDHSMLPELLECRLVASVPV